MHEDKQLLPGAPSSSSNTDTHNPFASPSFDSVSMEHTYVHTKHEAFVEEEGPSVSSTPRNFAMDDARPGQILGRVKKYLVNGGFDMKFENEEFPAGLNGRVSYREFAKLVNELNEEISRYRTKKGDMIALSALLLMYMPVFLYRKKKRSKKRKKSITTILDQWNEAHPYVQTKIDKTTGDLVFQEWLAY